MIILHTSSVKLNIQILNVIDFAVNNNEVTFYTSHDSNSEHYFVFGKKDIFRPMAITIGKQTFSNQDVLDNPQRIFRLMKEDILNDTLEKLP